VSLPIFESYQEGSDSKSLQALDISTVLLVIEFAPSSLSSTMRVMYWLSGLRQVDDHLI